MKVPPRQTWPEQRGNFLPSCRNNEVVPQLAHTFDVPGDISGTVLLLLGIDEAAQLDDSAERGDVDLMGFDYRIARQRGFNPGCGRLVVGVFTRAFPATCHGAAGGEDQRKRIEASQQH